MYLTKGRRDPFPGCGHRGFGKTCHRCAQGKAEKDPQKAAALLAPPKKKGLTLNG